MEEEITPKEHTWLVIKYGPDYARKLYWVQEGLYDGNVNSNLSELEERAARIGKSLVNSDEELLIQEMTKQIQEEVDRQILDQLVNKANGNETD